MDEFRRVDEANLWKVLKGHILRNTGGEGIFGGNWRELSFHYHDNSELPVQHFMHPVLIIIAQGSKFVRIGKDDFIYPEGSFLSAPLTCR